MGLRGVWGVAWEGWWPALAGWVVGPGDISRGCAKMGLHPTTPIVFNGARSSLGELVLGGGLEGLSCHLRWVADRLGSARGGGAAPFPRSGKRKRALLSKMRANCGRLRQRGGGAAGRAPNSLARLCRDFVSTLRTSPALPRLYRDFADFADFSGSADFAGFADFADFAEFTNLFQWGERPATG